MHTITHTIRRLTLGLALVATTALVASQALAGTNPRHTPAATAASDFPGLVATQLGSPDPRDSTAASADTSPDPGLVATQLGSPDPRDSIVASVNANLDPGLVATQLGSPDPRDTSLASATTSGTVGFQWGDFGAGIAATVGFMLLLAASTRLLAAHRGRKQQSPVATA